MTTVPIFVSSTFRDFHGERDLLHRQVRPLLNAALADHDASVALVDLRWGIDLAQVESERDRTRAILTVCAREIDRCNPLVIGMLGDYYGWIPGDKYARRFIPRVEEFPADRSITDLELRYALATGSLPPLVFRRRVLGAHAAPRERGDDRLSELLDLCAEKMAYHEYFATQVDGAALDVSEFVGVAVQAIAARVVDHLDRRHKQPTTRQRPLPTKRLEGRLRELEALKSAIDSPRRRAVVSGPSGVGKTALVETVTHNLAEQGWTAVVHRVTQAQPSEGDLVRSLASALGTDPPAGDPVEAVGAMARLLGRRNRLVVVVDSAEHFVPGPEHDRLRAILRLPPDIAVVVTTTSPRQVETLARGDFVAIRVGPIVPEEVARAVGSTLQALGRELPRPALSALASSPRSGLWVRLAIDLMVSVGEEVYVRAASHADPDQGLAQELTRVATELPDDDGALAAFALQRADDVFGAETVADLLGAVAASPWAAVEVDRLTEMTGVAPSVATQVRYVLGEAIIDTDLRSFAAIKHEVVEEAIRVRYLVDPIDVHSRLVGYYQSRVEAEPRLLPALIHHSLNSDQWAITEFAFETLWAARLQADASTSAVVAYLMSASDQATSRFLRSVETTPSRAAVAHLTSIVTAYETRRLPARWYMLLAKALLASPVVTALRDEPTALLSDLLVASAEIANRVGDRNSAIRYAEEASMAAGRLRRREPTPQSEARATTALLTYLHQFINYFDDLMGDENCSGCAKVISDVESRVRQLALPNAHQLLAETLTTRLRLCGRCPTSTLFGNRSEALEELISLRRADLQSDGGAESMFSLATALLRSADAVVVESNRVPHLLEAESLLEQLVRTDSGSTQFVLALAHAKRAKAIAYSRDIHTDEDMRVAQRQAAALAQSVVASDLRDARDLEAAIHVLTETGAASVLHRRPERKLWYADVDEGIRAYRAALVLAEDAGTPAELRAASGSQICRWFPKFIDDVSADLAFASRPWMRAWYGRTRRVDFEAVTAQHNDLLEIWMRAARLTGKDVPALADYDFIRTREQESEAGRTRMRRRLERSLE